MPPQTIMGKTYSLSQGQVYSHYIQSLPTLDITISKVDDINDFLSDINLQKLSVIESY